MPVSGSAMGRVSFGPNPPQKYTKPKKGTKTVSAVSSSKKRKRKKK